MIATDIECCGCGDSVPSKDCLTHDGVPFCRECVCCKECGCPIEPARLGLSQCSDCKARDDAASLPSRDDGPDPEPLWEWNERMAMDAAGRAGKEQVDDGC